jgi:class 3 adenylate cyclase/CheY-like chemotaxis protein
MTAAQGSEQARRVQRALLAYLRQEFTAPAAAIVGYVDILIEDAKRLSLTAYLSDLERIHSAGHSLHSLLQSVLAHENSDGSVIFDPSKLRHDLRTPINAIKGYGEMLVEDAASDGHEGLLADLGKLLTAADGVLKLIDALVDFRAESAERAGSKPIAGMGGVVEAVRAIRAVSAAPVGRDICGRILVVDDNASNRDLLGRQLSRAGHAVTEAPGGHAALAMLDRQTFDLILLDMMMPDISGYEVLHRLKAQPTTAEIPVIMISALDDLDSVMRCNEAGAVDYLLKPFDPTLLRARIGSSVENKILRDREKVMVEELRREKARSEELLLSILPRSIVERINAGETMIADHVDDISILFADIVGFTRMASRQTPGDLVKFLNSIFSAFDKVSDRFGAEKIKTIGDAYMVAFGLPDPRRDHAEAAALQARAMLDEIARLRAANGAPIELRVGVHTGPAVAGIIGQRKFSFDVWGTTVNIASRMESLGEPGQVHVSEAVAQALAGRFSFIERGWTEVRGVGRMRTFFLGDPIGPA